MTDKNAGNTINTGSSDNNDSRRRALRQSLRFARDQLSPEIVARHSQYINNKAWHLIGQARYVAGYFALGHEVNVSALMTQCRQSKKNTYVPVVQSDHRMVFAPVDDSTLFVSNRYGIQEPVADEASCRSPELLDVVLVPLVGFDANCNRLGMGGGYYDRCFAHRRDNSEQQNSKPLLIGVAFEQQCAASVFADWWDVPLDYVVTENRIISRTT